MKLNPYLLGIKMEYKMEKENQTTISQEDLELLNKIKEQRNKVSLFKKVFHKLNEKAGSVSELFKHNYGLIFLIMVGVGGAYYLMNRQVFGSHIVVFDSIKYLNSQRALASGLIKEPDNAELALQMVRVNKETEQVIKEVAGANAVVIAKQAYLIGPAEDITDKVLLKLKMPINVPTVELKSTMIDIAPTNLSYSALAKENETKLDKLYKEGVRSQQLEKMEMDKVNEKESVIP